MEKYKCVLSLRVARDLLAKDFELVDIQTSTKRAGKLVFVFRNNDQLEEAMSQYKMKGSR